VVLVLYQKKPADDRFAIIERMSAVRLGFQFFDIARFGVISTVQPSEQRSTSFRGGCDELVLNAIRTAKFNEFVVDSDDQ
jgi:hypothetical protein